MERVDSELVARCIIWSQCVIQSEGEPFTTTQGAPTKIYYNLRRLPSNSNLKRVVMDEMAVVARELEFDHVVGVPQAAIVYAASMAERFDKSQLFAHFTSKDHGIDEPVSGIYQPDQTALIVEDTSTSGNGIIKTARLLRNHGLKVRDSIVIVDRLQGARENVETEGIRFHALTTAPEVLRFTR